MMPLILLVIYTGMVLRENKANVTESIPVFYMDSSIPDELSWTYNDAEFTAIKQDGNWVIKGYEDTQIDESNITGMIYRLCTVTATRVIEEPANLSEYGLDDPTCEITMHADGETYHFAVGDVLQTSSSNVYFSNGDGCVYVVKERMQSIFSVDSIEELM